MKEIIPRARSQCCNATVMVITCEGNGDKTTVCAKCYKECSFILKDKSCLNCKHTTEDVWDCLIHGKYAEGLYCTDWESED